MLKEEKLLELYINVATWFNISMLWVINSSVGKVNQGEVLNCKTIIPLI